MNEIIHVSYDQEDSDMPCILCADVKSNEYTIVAGYFGDTAVEMHRMVTEQGYFDKYLSYKKKLQKIEALVNDFCPNKCAFDENCEEEIPRCKMRQIKEVLNE